MARLGGFRLWSSQADGRTKTLQATQRLLHGSIDHGYLRHQAMFDFRLGVHRGHIGVWREWGFEQSYFEAQLADN